MQILNYFRPKQKGQTSDTEKPPLSTSPASTYLIDEKAPSPLAIIYRSELDYLARCVLDYPNIETGGQLFGYWTSQGAPVVLYVIGPGRNANHQQAFFNQDINYLDSIGNELLNRYALQHIGEWHSHHQLGLARPSGHDARTMFHGLQSTPLRRLLLCICNYDNGHAVINPYTFHENDLHHYTDAMWMIKEMESPFRPLADKALAHLLIHPRTLQPLHGTIRDITARQETAHSENVTVQFSSGYWLMHPGNISIMKEMVALVQAHWPEKRVTVQANADGIAQINVNEGEIIFRYPKNFPREAPQLLRNDVQSNAPAWNAPMDDNGIFETFKDWFASLNAPDMPN